MLRVFHHIMPLSEGRRYQQGCRGWIDIIINTRGNDLHGFQAREIPKPTTVRQYASQDRTKSERVTIVYVICAEMGKQYVC